MTVDAPPDRERDAPSEIVDATTLSGLTCERCTRASSVSGTAAARGDSVWKR